MRTHVFLWRNKTYFRDTPYFLVLCTHPLPFLTHLCLVESSTSSLWTGPIPIEGGLVRFLLLQCFIEIPVFYADSVDPDQMPCSAVSDLGLHCLPMSLLWDTRL